MKNLLFIPFLILALFVGFYGGVIYKDSQAKKVAAVNLQTERAEVNFMFDFGDGKIKTFNKIAIENNATVFSIIEKISQEKGLDLSAKDYGSGMGAFIEGIDGHINDYSGDKYWQFWVNNEYAKVGAGSYVLQGGELVEWKFIKGQVE